MIVKYLVVALLLLIVVSLFQGMYYLARDDGEKDRERLLRALTLRVSLSLLLFVLLMFGYWMSWINPVGAGASGSDPAEPTVVKPAPVMPDTSPANR